MKSLFFALVMGVVVAAANLISYAAIMNGPDQLKNVLEAPKEVGQLRAQLELSRQSEQILRDQLADYSNQLAEFRAARTYEEGLRDGIVNANNSVYMQGYHAATRDTNVFASGEIVETVNSK